MKKKCLLMLTTILLLMSIFVCSCTDDKKKNNYSLEITEKTVLNFINEYSKLLGVDLLKDKREYDKNRVFTSVSGINIRINSNDQLKKVFIDFSSEDISIDKIINLSQKAIRVLDSQFSEKDFATTWRELKTFKYWYEPYKIREFEITMSKDDLYETTNKRYLLKISFKVKD